MNLLDTIFHGYILLLCWCCYLTHPDGQHDNEGHHMHTKEKIDLAITYLTKYGYVHPANLRGTNKKYMQQELREGITRFQYFALLKMTGIMDDPTVKQMKLPRCGVPDPPISLSKRKRRYSIQGSKWNKKLITWRLVNRARTLKREIIKRVINKATALWSSVANINFKETSKSKVDMWITFGSGYHGDNFPFDGPNGTIGHGFFPVDSQGISGDMHFDDDENFVYKSTGGYDIMHVILHEMGHALGLEHSNVKEAIMYPWVEYGSYKKNLQLHVDDVNGLQRLYGKKEANPTVAPKYCPRNFFTAVFFHKRYNVYVAITDNQQMYFIHKDGSIKSGPLKTKNYFPKSRIPDRIDAAFSTTYIHRHYDLTVIFAGQSYYIYDGLSHRSGPHSIHSRYEKDGVTKTPLEIVLPDWVRKVDAVFTWTNGDTYLFYGQWYWRYNYIEKRFTRGYPRITSTAWKGFPNRIHTAFTLLDGTTAFMLENRIYHLEKGEKKVAKGFPIYVGKSKWLHCKYPG